MLVQLSKSNRAFTCHTCVKSKFHLVFNQLHEEIEEIISKQDGQLISPTTCEAHPLIPLSPMAPLPPLIIQVSPKPLSPSAPLLTSLVAPTPSIIHPTQTSVATPQPPSLKNQIPSSSPANKPACKFYMQGRCKNGRKGTNCSFPHPKMCFRFIRSGNKGCNKGSSCQYAHTKLCYLLTLGCLAASSSQPGHHGVSAISSNLHDPGCYLILAHTENQAL